MDDHAQPGEEGRAVDTIAAIATPGGRGGIGIVRISGPDSARIGAALCGSAPEPRTARYCRFRDASGRTLDRGIVLYFRAPASYTGEDVLELHGHGGRVVMNMLLASALELGARPARPGEFTERAFLNGRLDLLQAEAVADLIDSASETAARSALRSLEGGFSQRIAPLVSALTDLRAELEAELDFPDEGLEQAAATRARRAIAALLAQVDLLITSARGGRVLREGVRVIIAGQPNAGKSSLMNRLLETERAIVAAEPGTTRDTLEEDIEVGGIRMNVVDTAGIRETTHAVEAEGVRRSLAAIAGADVVVIVTAPGSDETGAGTARHVPEGRARILVRNKIDLCGEAAGVERGDGQITVRLSAKTGAGVDLLVEALLEFAGQDAGEDAILARARHLEALEKARAAAGRALALASNGGAAELIAEELRQAQHQLGMITGAVSADDLLGEIFSRFCIGK